MEKVLIVYPYSNLATNPTMCTLIGALVRVGYHVDLILEDSHRDEFPKFLALDGSVEQLNFDDRVWWQATTPGFAKWIWKMSRRPTAIDPAWFRRFATSKYAYVIGVDPVGIATAADLNRFASRPLAYLSFEILLTDEAEGLEETGLKLAEKTALQDCGLVLIQDPERAKLLAADNGLDQGVFCYVPVAPAGPLPQRTDYLRERLGIAPQQKIVLFQGTIAGWSGRDEWEGLLANWTADIALVIHSRRKLGDRHRKLLDRLQAKATDRLYISDQPVSSDELLTLTASADVGLVSYFPSADQWHTFGNLETIGLASGKFSTFLMCGVPVLANQRTSLGDLVEQHQLGAAYDLPVTSMQSLNKIFAAQQTMSAAARKFYDQRLDPNQAINTFVKRLEDL